MVRDKGVRRRQIGGVGLRARGLECLVLSICRSMEFAGPAGVSELRGGGVRDAGQEKVP